MSGSLIGHPTTRLARALPGSWHDKHAVGGAAREVEGQVQISVVTMHLFVPCRSLNAPATARTARGRGGRRGEAA